MTTSDQPDATLRLLAAPRRYALAAAVAAMSLVTGCVVHALVAARSARLEPTLALVRRLQLSDLALVPNEDLRHPGWGRPEQGRAGQPSLPDPRAVRILVQPQPMKVIR